MKIVYLITRMDEYGGAQVHVRDMALWMRDQGHDVTVLSGYPGRVSDVLLQNGIDYRCVPSLIHPIRPVQDWKAFLRLRRLLKAVGPDLVSCHSSKAGLIGRLAARSLGIKVIFTAHGWSFSATVARPTKWLYAQLERLSARFGDHIITVSRFDRDLAIKKHIAAPGAITAIHNGMPILPAPPQPASAAVPQLVMVARFGAQKDHYTLLGALEILKEKPWHLHLVGNGDEGPTRQQAVDLDISHKITFHGERDDVSDFLTRQDIFLLISHWEGFPRSILEAMRAGLPVITTDTAGSPEAVTDGETGHVVAECDPVELSEAISRLLDDPELRTAMGRAGRKRYEEDFTFDRMAAETLTVYQNVTGQAPSKRQAPPEQPLRKYG